MPLKLTPPEWLIIGLLITVLGRLEQSYWLTVFGGLIAFYGFYQLQRLSRR